MLKRELGKEAGVIEIFLARQIQTLSESVNLDERLKFQAWQIPPVAAQLIELYPVETLEDFVLCFRRGTFGYYGTVYKLDASVLCDWMQKYLDEKYSIVENKAQEIKKSVDESNEVNYEAFKKRAPEIFAKDKNVENILNDADYIKRRIENPYKYYTVENLQIYATSQVHAEELVEQMIKSGELIREEETNEKNERRD